MAEQLRFFKVKAELAAPSISTVKELASDDTNSKAETCDSFTSSHNNSNWQLIVMQEKKGGLIFQTNIKNIADVVNFLNETVHYFISYDSPLRTPSYFADRSCQKLTITNKLLELESVLHDVFKKNIKTKRSYLKKALIRLYFHCFGKTYLIFSKPYFLPLFEAQLDSMTASAIAAFITYSQCRHVPAVISPLSRETVAEFFRQEAKSMLEDALFEEEPNIMTVGTLMLLCQCAMVTLQNKEARLYISLAWRMVIQLKDKYTPILQNMTEETLVTPEVIMAETWRRMFYTVRFLEVTMFVIHDGLVDCSPFLIGSGIGYPMSLSNERPFKDCVDAVNAFRSVVQLHSCQLSTQADELRYQLLAGSLDTIAVSDIERLENQLVNFWKSLPPSFRLSDSPVEHLQMDRIQQCDNPHAIYLNQLYYAYWLGLQTRLMRAPSAAETLDVDMNRFDGDRALFLVSVCCDSLSKIFHVLFCRLPCSVELHWLLVASNAMTMLKTATNTHIRTLAEKNFAMTLHVLKQRIQSVSCQQIGYMNYHDSADNVWANIGLANDLTDATSSSTGTTSEAHTFKSEFDAADDRLGSLSNEGRPPAPYFDELKRTLNTYFANHEHTILI
ncbi:hypothetical protein BDF20DRAFT_905312 [Mycotypha africana]|uniref:uncharacterized protein n=1 Tax=Mycotypha africana TaxID=64632 RepID=UPI002300907E|nr:uncharacterized protein BDF20DRAFT_905312 [Mycotypha africana]KAI8984362.1 hypothetical protein BDF20DRAFT_905312 [Mycotypha africana]